MDSFVLGCSRHRWCGRPWLPYPRLAVAELQPPNTTARTTSWDFSLIDPMMCDLFAAQQGNRSVVINFSTIPEWMYETPNPVPYPDDPNQARVLRCPTAPRPSLAWFADELGGCGQATWDYEQGTVLRDPTGQEVADYYARLVSWYTAGGTYTGNNPQPDEVSVWGVLRCSSVV